MLKSTGTKLLRPGSRNAIIERDSRMAARNAMSATGSLTSSFSTAPCVVKDFAELAITPDFSANAKSYVTSIYGQVAIPTALMKCSRGLRDLPSSRVKSPKGRLLVEGGASEMAASLFCHIPLNGFCLSSAIPKSQTRILSPWNDPMHSWHERFTKSSREVTPFLRFFVWNSPRPL